MRTFKSLNVLLVLTLLLLAACSNSSGGSSQEASGQDEVFVFKTSIQSPPGAALSEGFDAYLNSIEEKSNGRIKFERYYSESLLKSADALDGVSAGIADVAVIIPILMPSKIPLSTVAHNPVAFENVWAGMRAFYELYQKYPEMNGELEKQNVKYVGQLSVPSNYVFTKKPVDSLEDLKGMKLIAQGDQGLIAQELGATAVVMASTEMFEALQRGAVDGTMFGITPATTYGIEQVASNLYMLPIGGQTLLIGMNLDKYNALPDDLKQIFMDAALEQADTFHKIYQIDWGKRSDEKLQAANVQTTKPTEADIAKLREIAQNVVWNKWVSDNGPRAKEILDDYLQLTAKYEQENPYKGQ